MSFGLQSSFAAALFDPAAPAPAAIASSAGGPRPERRFAVYRNNVAVGLVRALETRFPAVRRIVGEAFFAEAARAYAFARPPRSPLMMTYGDDFADFLARLPALEELSYPADVARLEAARTRAYHAADAEPLRPEVFAAVPPEELEGLRLRLHPSLEIVRSRHPVVTIWAMNAGEAELAPIDRWSPEDALVARPGMDVTVRSLPPGGAAFLAALARGAALGDAVSEAAAGRDDFDLALNLAGLLSAGLAVGLDGAAQPGAEP